MSWKIRIYGGGNDNGKTWMYEGLSTGEGDLQ